MRTIYPTPSYASASLQRSQWVGQLSAGVTIADLSGAASGSGTSSGALTATTLISGTAAGSGTTTGALVAPVLASGTGAGFGAATGALSVTTLVTGTAAGAGASTGTLSVTAPITGASSGAGAATGALSARVLVTGSSAGIGSTVGQVAFPTFPALIQNLVRGGALTFAFSDLALPVSADGVGLATGVLAPLLTGAPAGLGNVSGVLSVPFFQEPQPSVFIMTSGMTLA